MTAASDPRRKGLNEDFDGNAGLESTLGSEWTCALGEFCGRGIEDDVGPVDGETDAKDTSPLFARGEPDGGESFLFATWG
jgi:hypothetical protein